MRTVTAYAANAPKAALERTTISRREPGPRDVLIKIAYCGICHSDLHTAWGEWDGVNFPVVPGHEIAGVVAEVGSEVHNLSVGDRVGVGCMVDSCRTCGPCLAGEEQFCENGAIFTYNSTGRDGTPTYGGYSTHIVVDQDFVLKIPEGIGLDVAAPLMCAGITLYSPLSHWEAGPDKEVAIVGLGGLGHMGVKIASALGARVTVLSQTDAKREDALRLGADALLPTSDPSTFKDNGGRFDLIINTVSATLDIDAYLSLLGVNGTLVNVGAPPDALSLHAFSLVSNRRSFAGSLIGGIRETQEMLDFCGSHNLGCEIELIGGEYINEAYARMLKSDVRFRFVIDTGTFE